MFNYPHEAERTPLQTHYLRENLIAPGIEPSNSRYVVRNSDHQNTETAKIIPLGNIYPHDGEFIFGHHSTSQHIEVTSELDVVLRISCRTMTNTRTQLN
jgi:hypothetical protein